MIHLKWYEIGHNLALFANKSHTGFPLVPKSITLNDPEEHKRHKGLACGIKKTERQKASVHIPRYGNALSADGAISTMQSSNSSLSELLIACSAAETRNYRKCKSLHIPHQYRHTTTTFHKFFAKVSQQ